MPTTSKPIALSDAALSTLMQLAQPLAPADRSRFLADVARELKGHSVVGDGLIARIGAVVQQRYRNAPDLVGRTSVGKYAR